MPYCPSGVTGSSNSLLRTPARKAAHSLCRNTRSGPAVCLEFRTYTDSALKAISGSRSHLPAA
jgi:hypothetical protein